MANLHDDSWRGTLTADRLQRYLASAQIDSIGGPKNVTPLAAACWQGHLNVVTLLLDNPHQLADPNALSPHGRTALYYATARSPKTDRAAIVHALLKAGANVDARAADDGGNTPLMNAVAEVRDRDVVRVLLDRGASLTVENDRGETAAALARGTPMEAALSERGAASSTLALIIDVVVSVVMLIVTYTNNYHIKDAVEAVASKLQEKFATPGAKNPPAKVLDNFNSQTPPVSARPIQTQPIPPTPVPLPGTQAPQLQGPPSKEPGKHPAQSSQTQPLKPQGPQNTPRHVPPTPEDPKLARPEHNERKDLHMTPSNLDGQGGLPPLPPASYLPGTQKAITPQIPTGQGAIAQIFGITGTDRPVPVPEVFEEVPVPKTPEEFVKSIDQFVADSGLDKFFAPGDRFLQTLAEKATALRHDPTTNLGSPENIKRLTRLSLYQTVVYCDDSASMGSGDRYHNQTELVRRIARVATRIVPDGYGVELRFINSPAASNLNAEQVESVMRDVSPNGGTMLGTGLLNKILQPLVYDVLADSRKRFERPLLVCVITDGEPSKEPPSTFKDKIVDCRRRLDRAGYEPTAVMFTISQIGDSKNAKSFLDGLKDDPQIQDVLYCTAERLDDEFKELRDNEKRLEEWLLKLLTSPIMGQEI